MRLCICFYAHFKGTIHLGTVVVGLSCIQMMPYRFKCGRCQSKVVFGSLHFLVNRKLKGLKEPFSTSVRLNELWSCHSIYQTSYLWSQVKSGEAREGLKSFSYEVAEMICIPNSAIYSPWDCGKVTDTSVTNSNCFFFGGGKMGLGLPILESHYI